MKLAAAIIVLCAPSVVSAITNTAASAAFADVEAAKQLCANGDTLQIPAGNVTWTNETLVVTNRIRIIGSDGGNVDSPVHNTIISRGTNANVLFQFNLNSPSPAAELWGMSRITIECNTNGTMSKAVEIGTSLTHTNRGFRFDNLTVRGIRVRGIVTTGRSEGLIDQCRFDMPANYTAQSVTFLGWQRAANAITNNPNDNVLLGRTNDFVYVENCRFGANYENDSAIEFYWDAQAVVRCCHITNTIIGVHENQINRAATVWEMYGNTITNNSSTGGPWITIRSGWGVIFSNTFSTGSAMSSPTILQMLYRASGTNVFPAGSGNYVYDTGVTGTNRVDGNVDNASTIGYPAMDQPGWGDPTLWSATNGVMTLHGVYGWTNTCNGTNLPISVRDFCATTNCNAGILSYDGVRSIPDSKTLIVEGRDFWNDTPKPLYTPLIYPHPLAGYTAPATNAVWNVGTLLIR